MKVRAGLGAMTSGFGNNRHDPDLMPVSISVLAHRSAALQHLLAWGGGGLGGGGHRRGSNGTPKAHPQRTAKLNPPRG